MHIRRSILEAIQARLKTLTVFSGVWIQRKESKRNSYPHITLYADAESVETQTIHPPPRPQERVLTVSIKAWIRGTIDDEKAEIDMDDAAANIETVISNSFDADDVILLATDFTVSENEPEIHVCTLTYQINYSTTEFFPII